MVGDGPGAERKFTNEMVTPQTGVNRGANTGFGAGKAAETAGTGVARYGAGALVGEAGRTDLNKAQISRLGRNLDKLARRLGIEPKMRAAMPRVPSEAIMEKLSETQIRRGDNTFQIAKFTEVPDALIEVAIIAAEITLRENTGEEGRPPESTIFRFVFDTHLVDEFGDMSTAAGGYSHSSDFHIFPLDILRKSPGGYTLEEEIAMATAHEVVHGIQRREGQEVRQGHEMSRTEYVEDPYENRARQAEMRVLELLYPETYYQKVFEATGFSREFAEQISGDYKVAMNNLVLMGAKRTSLPEATSISHRESAVTSLGLQGHERSSITSRFPRIGENRLSRKSPSIPVSLFEKRSITNTGDIALSLQSTHASTTNDKHPTSIGEFFTSVYFPSSIPIHRR